MDALQITLIIVTASVLFALFMNIILTCEAKDMKKGWGEIKKDVDVLTQGIGEEKEAKKLAQEFFKLEIPLTEADLKKAYRKACMKFHPDRGGDEERFKAIGAAYEFLTSDTCVAAGIFSNGFSKDIYQTVEEIPFSK